MKLALKLLYQFRVVINGSSGTYRKCEERYIMMDVENDDVDQALDRFFAKIKESNYRSKNTAGHTYYYEFVGVLDYILWDVERDEELGEFWYDYRVKKLPMENRKKLTLSKAEIKKRIRNQGEESEKNLRKSRGARLNILTDFDWLMKNYERRRRRHEREEKEKESD